MYLHTLGRIRDYRLNKIELNKAINISVFQYIHRA
jgi:hypothetical protein